MLIDLADFALQEQAEDKLMVAISRPWYNGSYTMAALKPIKTLELHYTMIQFLIILVLSDFSKTQRYSLKKLAQLFQIVIHFHPGHLQLKTLRAEYLNKV